MATGQTSARMARLDPDVRLMLQVRDNDSQAFAELVERYQARLIAVLQHMLGQAQEAEDLAQEVFLRVYKTRAKYTPKAKFSTWLFTIANNLALNALRDRKRRPIVNKSLPDSTASGPWSIEQLATGKETPPSQQLQQMELAEVVRHAIDQLNDRQRLAILLNKFEDMSYCDIGAVMGLNETAVKSLLSRARSQLRELLQPYIEMEPIPPAHDADQS